MAGIFPTLTTGSVAQYPLTRGLVFPVKIAQFLDDTEQAWRSGPALNNWVLSFKRLKWADVQTIHTFWNTQKGDFDSTWSWPIDGTTWTSMVFTDAKFPDIETYQNQHSLTLNIKQTKQSSTYASGPVSTFPTINGGVAVQFPFEADTELLTTKNLMESGLQYAWYWRTAALGRWPLRFPVITNSECGTLFDFYAKCLGAYKKFSFTDPNTGVTHTNCRFGLAPITRIYRTANTSDVSLLIEETA
jgi:hypothetical protein